MNGLYDVSFYIKKINILKTDQDQLLFITYLS